MKTHPEWTVLNRGIDGQRSDEILARFDRDVTEDKPNYVIILAGVNDIFQGAPLESTKNNLLLMYQNSISAGIRPVSASVLPYNTASRRSHGNQGSEQLDRVYCQPTRNPVLRHKPCSCRSGKQRPFACFARRISSRRYKLSEHGRVTRASNRS